MTTIDNIMALHNAASHAAVQYALLAQVSLRSERSMQALEDRNEANEALRAALAQQAEQGWQPIETAPKDGTDVIAGHPDGSIDVLSWLEVKNNRQGWTDGEYFALSWPTHWMPLPAAPKGGV